MLDHKTELTNLNEYFCRQKCRKRLNFLSNFHFRTKFQLVYKNSSFLAEIFIWTHLINFINILKIVCLWSSVSINKHNFSGSKRLPSLKIREEEGGTLHSHFYTINFLFTPLTLLNMRGKFSFNFSLLNF